jgi:hypothetical protein
MENKLTLEQRNYYRAILGLNPVSEEFSRASGSYGLRLDSINTQIKGIEDFVNSTYTNKSKWTGGNNLFVAGDDFPNRTTFGNCSSKFSHWQDKDHRAKCEQLSRLIKEKKTVIAEMIKEEQYLKDQELLQQQAATKAAQAAAEKAQALIEKAQAEIEASKNKSLQEQNKAQQELQKAMALQRLVSDGDKDAMKIALGQGASVKSNKGLIIGGIIIGALGVGFIVYKMLAKKKVV